MIRLDEVVNSEALFDLTSGAGFVRYWGTTKELYVLGTEIATFRCERTTGRDKEVSYDCTGGRCMWYVVHKSLGVPKVYVNDFLCSKGSLLIEDQVISNQYGENQPVYIMRIGGFADTPCVPVRFE